MNQSVDTSKYKPLAQGEYNANYTFTDSATGSVRVLRVNHGSQMHLDNQIDYEANALRMLADSGRTPLLFEVVDPCKAPGNGALVEEYLEGVALDYNNSEQMVAVAKCLADIHSLKMPVEHGLIEPENSLKAILDECEEMLEVYLGSVLPDKNDKLRLRRLLDKAWKLVPDTPDDIGYKCCINTELNSSNFIIKDGIVKLVDWEKPLYGDPAQDIGHFLAPTTSYWKTDVIFSQDTIERFIKDYIDAVDGRYDTTGLRERTLDFITITCLRGMTWCAMAWVQYQQNGKELVNEFTWMKINQYLDDTFFTLIEAVINRALMNK